MKDWVYVGEKGVPNKNNNKNGMQDYGNRMESLNTDNRVQTAGYVVECRRTGVSLCQIMGAYSTVSTFFYSQWETKHVLEVR